MHGPTVSDCLRRLDGVQVDVEVEQIVQLTHLELCLAQLALTGVLADFPSVIEGQELGKQTFRLREDADMKFVHVDSLRCLLT